MSSQDGTVVRRRRMCFAVVCLAATAPLLSPGATAKDTEACTAGTTLRLSAPEASQGSLLLIEVKSAKALAEVQGDWGGRSVPFWRDVAGEAHQKGLLGVDIAKAPRKYEMKGTGATGRREKKNSSVMVAVRVGPCSTGRLPVGQH